MVRVKAYAPFRSKRPSDACQRGDWYTCYWVMPRLGGRTPPPVVTPLGQNPIGHNPLPIGSRACIMRVVLSENLIYSIRKAKRMALV